MTTSDPNDQVAQTNPYQDADALFDDGEDEAVFVASAGTLMWWRFKKHRMAVVSAVILILFYTQHVMFL